MERRIFKFGGNSVALIIPKKWLDKSGLGPKSSVYLSESESGNLVVSPKETAKREAEKIVSRRTRPAFLSRWVGLHYMYGTGRLRIYSSEGLTRAQVEGIEAKIGAECPGFEVTSQSDKDIIVEDLTNIKEVDLDKILLRLRSLIAQEFVEIARGDVDTIPRTEKIVNRFYMLGVRYVNITQAKDALMYYSVLGYLEAISDRLNEISAYFKAGNGKAYAKLGEEFGLCYAAMKGDSKAIERVAELREEAIAASGSRDKVYSKLLTEVADSIANIAEFGLKSEDNGGSF